MDKYFLTTPKALQAFQKNRKYDAFVSAVNTVDFSNIFITRLGKVQCNPDHFWNTDKRFDYCLQYIADGKGEFFVNDTLYALKKHDLFLVPKQRAHYYRADKNEPYTMYYIHFNGAGIQRFFELIHISEDSPVISVPSKKLPDLFHELIVLCKNSSQTNQLRLLSKTYELLYEIGLHTVQEERPSLPRQQQIVNNVQAYISEHFSSKITLDDLANVAHLNKRYLCSLFRKQTGLSPIQYLIEYRISRACNLFTYDYTLTEIAYMCGFSTLADFSRCFMRHTKSTPSEYQRGLQRMIQHSTL